MNLLEKLEEENGCVKTNSKSAVALLNRWMFQGWTSVGIALVSFAAGSLVTLRLAHPRQVKADSNRVFELRIYHTIPGKVPALESIFRDVSKLISKHDLQVIGYWVPNDDPAWANTFVYLVAHPSQEGAKKDWQAVYADPAFPEYRRRAAQFIEKVGEDDYKVDEVYMRPTDYSAMK